MRVPRFQTTANGEPIENYILEKPPVRIIQAGLFEEIEARIMAGLTQEQYDALPGTPDWITDDGASLSKSHIVAFYRLKHQIEGVFYMAQKRQART